MIFNELTGSATNFTVQPDTVHFIPNNCNNRGLAGSGFILAIKDKYPKAILEYESWFEGNTTLNSFPKCLDKYNSLFEMGNIQVVKVEPEVYVVNMLGQKGFGDYGMPPGRYESIEECLRKLKVCCKGVVGNGKKVSIEACKFGSARSGLDWTKVFSVVQEIFSEVEGTWNTYSYDETSQFPSYYKV